jgi:hypothetical protein
LDLVQLFTIESPYKESNRLAGFEIAYMGRFITVNSDAEIVFADFRTGKTIGKVRY